MTTCAVISTTTWQITNVIVATASDSPPPGSIFIGVPDGLGVDTNWQFATGVGFISPDAQDYYAFNAGVAPLRTVAQIRTRRTAKVDAFAAALAARADTEQTNYPAMVLQRTGIPATQAQINQMAANVATFKSAVTANQTSLDAAIAAASTLAQFQAIDLQSGWPRLVYPA